MKYYFTFFFSLFLIPFTSSLFAEGSKNVNHPENKGSRVAFYGAPYLEVYAYAYDGEVISIASSAMGLGDAKIEIIDPKGRKYEYTSEDTEDGSGIIYNRIQELGLPGLPESPGVTASRFKPLFFPVYRTEIGVWTIRFYPPGDKAVELEGTEPLIANENWLRGKHQADDNRSILAWDVTVTNGMIYEHTAEVHLERGRVFCHQLPVWAKESEERGMHVRTHVRSAQGYDYGVLYHGMGAGEQLLTCSNNGVVSSESKQPVYQSVVADNKSFELASFYPAKDGSEAFKQFFEKPAPTLPRTTYCHPGSTWLAPEMKGKVSCILREMVAWEEGESSPVCMNFEFDGAADYHFILDANENGVLNDEGDVELRGQVSEAGIHCVEWDGRDGNGNYILSKNAYKIKIQVKVMTNLHAVASNTSDLYKGVSILKLNGEQSENSEINWNDLSVSGGSGANENSPAHAWKNGLGKNKHMDTWSETDLTIVEQRVQYWIKKDDGGEEDKVLDLEVASVSSDKESYCQGETAITEIHFQNNSNRKAEEAFIIIETPFGMEVDESSLMWTTQGEKTKILSAEVDEANHLIKAFADLDRKGAIDCRFVGKIQETSVNDEEAVIAGICKPKIEVENDFVGGEDYSWPNNMHEMKNLYIINANNIRYTSFLTSPSIQPEFVLEYDTVECSGREMIVKVKELNWPTIFTVENLDLQQVILTDTSTTDSMDLVLGIIEEEMKFRIEGKIDHVCGTSLSEEITMSPTDAPEEIEYAVEDTSLCANDKTTIKIFPIEEGTDYRYAWDKNTGKVKDKGIQGDTLIWEVSQVKENVTLSIWAEKSNGCTSSWEKEINFTVKSIGDHAVEINNLASHLCNDQEEKAIISGLDKDLEYDFINANTQQSLLKTDGETEIELELKGESYDIYYIVYDAESSCLLEESIIYLPHIEVEAPDYVADSDVLDGCDSAQVKIELGEEFPVEYEYVLKNKSNQEVEARLPANSEDRTLMTDFIHGEIDLLLYATDAQGLCQDDMATLNFKVQESTTLDVEIKDYESIVCDNAPSSISFYGKDGIQYQVWDTKQNTQIGSDHAGNDEWVDVEFGILSEPLAFGIKEKGECTSWKNNEGELVPVKVEFEIVTDKEDELEEGCDSTRILITRPTHRSQYTVDFKYYGQADNELDYQLSQEEIHFEHGQESAVVMLYALADEEEEETEKVLLSVGTDVCNADREYVEYSLIDIAPLMVQMKDKITIDSGIDILLKPQSVSGGKGEYTYLWNGVEGHDQMAFTTENDTVIIFTVIDECGTRVDHELEIDVLVSSEEVQNSAFKVYPNPASSSISLAVSENTQIQSIQLLNAVGQIVEHVEGKTTSISVNHLPTGVYMIRVATEKATYTERLVIRR